MKEKEFRTADLRPRRTAGHGECAGGGAGRPGGGARSSRPPRVRPGDPHLGTTGAGAGVRRHRRSGSGTHLGALSRSAVRDCRSRRRSWGASSTGWASRATGGRRWCPRWRAMSTARRINPAARAYPREFIQTGISAIDGMNSLVRGQKLPIFSGSGLPHNRLAAQIVRQAQACWPRTAGSPSCSPPWACRTPTRVSSRRDFEQSGVLAQGGDVHQSRRRSVHRASDPAARALTAAEYLAFDLDMHVLVVMTDMTHYAEALREVATAKGDVPSRKGYPGYLYSDLAEIYERAGRIKDRARFHHHDSGAVHAVGRHHPPDSRPHRLHHRGPDRA